MANPVKQNFKIKANGYWTQVWQIKNGDVPFDITGYNFELEIKKNRGFASPKFLNLVVGDGITVEDAQTGKIKIEIPPQNSVVGSVTYVYDLIAIKDGKPYVWIEGEMTFEAGVSYVGG